MIGLLFITIAVAAIPIGILLLVVKLTVCEKAGSSGGGGLSAICFGAASLLSLAAIDFWISSVESFIGLAVVAPPIMGLAALLAFIFHKKLFTSTKTIAVLGGGGIAIATVLLFAVLFASIFAPGKSEGMFIVAFVATMILVPFGIPLFVFGALVGLFINRLTKNNITDKGFL